MAIGRKMRNSLCDEDRLNCMMETNSEGVIEAHKELDLLKEDLLNGLQRYPYPTEVVIKNTQNSIFHYTEKLIRIKYSLGLKCEDVEQLFRHGIPFLRETEYDSIGYFHILHYISLAILLDAPKEVMQVFIDKIDEAEENDILLDYLVSAYGLKRKAVSTGYYKENPYKEMMDIIEIAKDNKNKASEMLYDYTEKHWLKAHSDINWPRLSKNKKSYCGFWSFEAGAVAKILKLDDSKLVNSDFYPYDLVHYKNGVEYREDAIDEFDDISGEDYKNIDGYKAGIPYNTTLEQIIPVQFHEKVTQLIVDYETMEDLDFWNKYELNQIWFDINRYLQDKKKGLLGRMIVFVLVDEGYICQLDWKEDLEDYEEHIRNYWKDEDIKLIEFDLGNDQQYYAKIPRENQICDIYEVKVTEVCNNQ